MFQNKKADERMLSFYWMIIFVLITIAVVAATVMFFSKPLDVRGAESRLLSDRIVSCIAKNGEVVVDIEGLDILGECDINFEDSTYNEVQYYVEVGFEDKKGFVGDENFEVYCGDLDSDEETIPVCHVQKMGLLKDGEMVFVEIKAVVRKVEQNAK